MMQEEVESRTVALAISAARFTGNTLRAAISKYLEHRKNKAAKDVHPKGKQSVKQLIGQNQGVASAEIDGCTKDFEKIARKYGVDYAVKKESGTKQPKYFVFVKAKDSEALNAAFKEYSASKLTRGNKPSVIDALRRLVKESRSVDPGKAKKKTIER